MTYKLHSLPSIPNLTRKKQMIPVLLLAASLMLIGVMWAKHALAFPVSDPPTAGTVTDGKVGQHTDNNDVAASWSGFADDVGIVKYWFSAGSTPGGTDLVNWQDVGLVTTYTDSTFGSHGDTVYINVKAEDADGQQSPVASTDGFTFDDVNPVQGTAADFGNYTSSSTSLYVSWSGFSDAMTGIAEYSYSIGTSAGNTSTLDWTSAGTATEVLATGLNLTDNTQYFINIRAKDHADNLSTVVSTNGIRVDSTAPESFNAYDDGQYTTSTTTLSGSWDIQDAGRAASSRDDQSFVLQYSYSIGTSAGATNVVDWTVAQVDARVASAAANPGRSFNRTDLTLTSGTTYYINVRAKNGAGILSTVASTDGITVDSQGPTAGTVNDAGSYTTSDTSLNFSWSGFSDAVSGLAEYSYSIGTSAGNTSVKDWTSIGTVTEFTATDLVLTSGQSYYINIRAKDNAGNLSTVASSDGITVDTSAPVNGNVYDDGEFTTSTTTISASWDGQPPLRIASATDPQSNVVEYSYSIGTSAGAIDTVPWTQVTIPCRLAARSASCRTASVALPTSINRTDLTLIHGTTYFVNIRVKNGAGLLSTVASSDGITVDAQGPVVGTVTDGGATTENGTQLTANWTAFTDAQSGLAEYSYSIGTSAGDISIKGWTSNGTTTSVTATDLNLTPQSTYFINVRAKDNLGNIGSVASSDGIQYVTDTEAPVPGTISDTGVYTSSATTLYASWSGFTDNEAVRSYEYSIGTSAGDTSTKDWTCLGACVTRNASFAEPPTFVLAEGLALSHGTTYFFNLRAKDGSGNTSTVVNTDGITIDTEGPQAGTVTDEGTVTGNGSQLMVTFTNFVDNHIGIDTCEYSIGTSAGNTSVRDWTNHGFDHPNPDDQQITATGLQLEDQASYFVNVRCKDTFGNIGAVASSNGIQYIADPDAPVAGTVADDGATTISTTTLSASWFGFTDASGIAEYSYSIGTSAGDSSVVAWTTNGTNTAINLTELTLTYGTTYFFNVRAKDPSGHLSAVASSNGIQVMTLIGDVDLDGDIDAQDFQLANRMSTGKVIPSAAQIMFGDVVEPKDGKITTEDANLILRCANGMIRGNPGYSWCSALTREAAAFGGSATQGGAP